MRTTMTLAILLATGILGVLGASSRQEASRPQGATPPARQSFIVHEWGTFTNFSTSDGTQLVFRSVLGEELPSFVRYHPFRLFTKGELVGRQRMETPVTYFYTDVPRTADVRINFPTGSLTEFYPPPIAPLADSFGVADQSDSSLAWRITIHPQSEFDERRENADGLPALPEVDSQERYGFARETDSSVVEATDESGEKHCEKFLFYRGVGNFTLPQRLEALSDRRFRAINDGPDNLEALFMVMIDDDGLRFHEYPRLAPHSALEMEVPESLATADELGDRMAAALVSAGLFKKEAQAMIDTWRSSWLREPGARLFYLLPQRLTDEIIPLSVEPAPDKVVRVMVARMEILTPETVSRLIDLANDSATGQAKDEQIASELARLGRFARPTLDYLAAQTSDPAARDAIARLRAMPRR